MRPADVADAQSHAQADSQTSRGAAFLRNWFSCIVIAMVLIPVTAAQPWRTYLNEPPIRSDGLGYHLWVRAILDRDLDFCRFQVNTGAVVEFPRPTATAPDRVRCGNQYPIGLALLQLPVMALLADHGADPRIANDRENEAAVWMGSVALFLTCVLVVATARRLRVPPWPTHVALLTMVFGTALFVFSTYVSAYTHVYLALGVAALLWAGIRTLDDGARWSSVVVAFLASFFVVSMRNLDSVVVVILVGAYVAVASRRRTPPWRPTRRLVVELAPVVVGMALASALQVVVNHHFSGVWSLSSYGVTFDWSQQMHRSVLFSYRRGLFTYWPIVAVVLVSGFAVRRARPWTLLFTLLIAALTAMYGFWPSWELGGGAGFGHRGFVEIVPVGIIAFAIALSALRRPFRILVGSFAVVCAFLTFQLALQMWNYEYPEYTPGSTAYWSHTLGDDALWRHWLP